MFLHLHNCPCKSLSYLNILCLTKSITISKSQKFQPLST